MRRIHTIKTCWRDSTSKKRSGTSATTLKLYKIASKEDTKMTDKAIVKKEKALELLKEMDIYKPYIRGFRESDKVCFFENFGVFWLHQEPEIDRKRQEIEAKYNCLVYAVTHEFTQFGELYDFLIVTDYPEEWDTLIYS
ncbi:hypothetical protein [uncultured Coprobacter sp.]|uniref:hypothetical protein n=1 Tax=uncultured Coprobacter sp. TaxID=1720550 RepID=UPI00263298A6|nr:hypothetical protein [uncultured Coprobacter sp.]